MDTFLIPQKLNTTTVHPLCIHTSNQRLFLLNSIKPCRPQTSWYCLSIPVSTEYQPCLPDVPVPTVPVPTIPRNHLQHPNHALLRRRKLSSIAAIAEMALPY
jgi:hypothetical protein